VEGVRTRLDRIYLEATVDEECTAESSNDDDVESKALREELESLYSEILPVAQMSAEQQYLEPALRCVGASETQAKARSSKAFDYVPYSRSFWWQALICGRSLAVCLILLMSSNSLVHAWKNFRATALLWLLWSL
jgi:hypothetical protein